MQSFVCAAVGGRRGAMRTQLPPLAARASSHVRRNGSEKVMEQASFFTETPSSQTSGIPETCQAVEQSLRASELRLCAEVKEVRLDFMASQKVFC